MSLWVPHSAFCDLQVDFGPPSLKYCYILHAKFWVSKPVIISDSCVIKLWFAHLQFASLKLSRSKELYFLLYFVFEWPVPVYIFAHWRNIACLCADIITHIETHSGSWKYYVKLWELIIIIKVVNMFVCKCM